MRRFLTQFWLFIFPVIILLSIPTFVLWKSKENLFSINETLKSDEKYLIHYAYDEIDYGYLKWTYLNLHKKKTVWALGSSRVLQFRGKMFDSSFYNAGYTIVGINDFRPFLKGLPVDKYPRYLIISLDQWMFNSSWDALATTPAPASWQNSFQFYPKLTNYKTIYKDLLFGKINFGALSKADSIHKIGLNALVNNKGFRNDGSIYYGKQIKKLVSRDQTAEDYKYADTFDRIKHGNRRFEYGNLVNEKALRELNEVLKYCKQHHIEVIAFMPPFADSVYDKMIASKKYHYLDSLYIKAKPIFDSYHYEIYNFSSVSRCNSNDNETIDGVHGGELTYEKILIKMLHSGSVLNKVTSAKRLETDLSKSINNYIVYGY